MKNNELAMTTKERILKFLGYLDVGQSAFEKKAGISNGYVNNLKGSVGSKIVGKISDAYPELNSLWLLTGEGEMLKNTAPTAEINYEHRGVPYFDVDFIGGFDLVENSQATNPEYYVDFKPYNNAQYWVNVTGRSMEPNISQGDMIAIKEVEHWQDFLLFGEIYAVVTNDFRTIKVVSQGETPDSFKLIPTNPDPQFSAQDVKKSMIRRVFQVMGAVKRF